MLFRSGLSGPSILNMSRDISELLKYGEVKISLDVLPSLDYGMLNEKLQNLFKENNNKKVAQGFYFGTDLIMNS